MTITPIQVFGFSLKLFQIFVSIVALQVVSFKLTFIDVALHFTGFTLPSDELAVETVSFS